MESAVIAIVKGGLGNQLFIYATARALALRTGRTLYLDSKLGYGQDDYGRSYRLDRLPIQARSLPGSLAHRPGAETSPPQNHPRAQQTAPAQPTHLPQRTREVPPGQLTALAPRRRRITLLGYWQNEAYFADHADAIRAELTPPGPTDEVNRHLGEQFAAQESVFLHFRRVRYWNLLGRDYYQQAIDLACARLAQPNFVLFGDDLDWPKQQLDFRGQPVAFITQNSRDELADLWLMSRCRHAVVANSSFSWWGAWLGDLTPRRQVFAPQNPGWDVVMPDRWHRIANLITPQTNSAA